MMFDIDEAHIMANRLLTVISTPFVLNLEEHIKVVDWLICLYDSEDEVHVLKYIDHTINFLQCDREL